MNFYYLLQISKHILNSIQLNFDFYIYLFIHSFSIKNIMNGRKFIYLIN